MNCKNQNDSWSERKRNDDSLNERKRLAQIDATKNIMQNRKSFDVESSDETLDNQRSEYTLASVLYRLERDTEICFNCILDANLNEHRSTIMWREISECMSLARFFFRIFNHTSLFYWSCFYVIFVSRYSYLALSSFFAYLMRDTNKSIDTSLIFWRCLSREAWFVVDEERNSNIRIVVCKICVIFY